MRIPLILLQIFFLTLASSNRTIVKRINASHHFPFRQRYCSRSDDDKIVGGAFVKNITRNPYQVSIMKSSAQTSYQHVCGGCLLTLNFVFTACHCLAVVPKHMPGLAKLKMPPDVYLFLAGTIDIQKLENTTQRRGAESIHIHPKCGKEKQLVFDLALVKMDKPFVPTPFVQPAKMYTWDREKFEYILHKMMRKVRKPKCTVAGWGEIRTGKFSNRVVSSRLKIVRMYPMEEFECHGKWMAAAPNDYANFNFWKHGQICALNAMLDSTDCVGDSGSPYICQRDRLVATVSYGRAGCSGEYPRVYTTVGELISWVKQKFSGEIDTTEPRKTHAYIYRKYHRKSHKRPKGPSSRKTGVHPLSSNHQAMSLTPIPVMIALLWR